MTRITRQDRSKIEQVMKKKRRTLEKVIEILKNIREDNPDTIKKDPEGRVKSLERIEEKIRTIEECDVSNFLRYIKDIAGARITCCTLDEIPIVEDIIMKHPEIKKCKVLRKYEEGADEEGYRGHHLGVTVEFLYENRIIKDICEIQIRTLAGDLWAVLSHRDFYKSPTKPPPSVAKDMLILSKQLEVVDDSALSLKQRIRDEINRQAREKGKAKLAEKDMLTLENIRKLVRNTFRKDISINFAYELIQFVLGYNVVSLKEYKKLITLQKYRTIIEDTFRKYKIKPELHDYLHTPVLLEEDGIIAGKRFLLRNAKERYEKTVALVEKEREIPKEVLKEEVKTSRPR